MGRTLRSSNVQSNKSSPAKRKHPNSVVNGEVVISKGSRSARSTVDRNILEDQTNKTPSPPKRARLRSKQADSGSSVSSLTDNFELSSQSKIADTRNKKCETEDAPKTEEIKRTKRVAPKTTAGNKIVNKNLKSPAKPPNALDSEFKMQDPPRASARIKRTASLKENESEVSMKIVKDKTITQHRPLRVNKEEILRSINESSESEEEEVEEEKPEPSTPYKEAKTAKALKVSTFYGNAVTDTVVSASEDKGPKSCVYKSNKEEQPLAIKPRSENERLALYEFEFDSSEEPKPKKKKKPARVKSKPAIKAKAKVASKNFQKPKAVKHIAPFRLQDKKPVAAASKPTVLPDMPSKQVEHATPVPPKQATTVVKPATPVKSPRKSLPIQDLPPLIHLFDDDDDDIEALSPVTATPTASPRSSRCVINGSPKTTGPIRFEYQEIIKARERVTKNSLTPRVKPATPSLRQDLMDNTLPADESTNNSSRLRQTSIRSFLSVQNDDGEEELVDDAGLFATGSRSAVVPTEEIKKKPTHIPVVSSTPQRPGKTFPPLQTFLSPVMASPQSRLSPSKSRTSPRKAMGTPEKVQPAIEVPRRSPRKMNSPVKDSPLPLPTRLSIGTLRAAMKSNVQVEAPSATIINEEFPSLEEIKDQPGSPQRNFRQPARKSYERRTRKAPTFLGIEEGGSDNEEEEECREEEDEDLLFGDVAADEGTSNMKLHQTKHHKKNKDLKQEENNKELDAWASRFNSQLEEVEHFSLAVE